MDINLVSHAKEYIDDLARGINPLTKAELAEGDIVNNVKISRCLFYVSGILGEVISAGAAKPAARQKQVEFNPPEINTAAIEISESPAKITMIVQRIDAAKPENMKKLKLTAVTSWLVSIDMLKIVNINGKNHKKPTANGKSLGIEEEQRQGLYGTYYSVIYNKAAQQFIVDNLSSIVDGSFNSGTNE